MAICLPIPFIAWVPIWLVGAQRGDGTSWSIPTKVVFTLAPFVPILVAAFVLSHIGAKAGGRTGLSLLSPLFVLLVAGLDAIFHRRQSG